VGPEAVQSLGQELSVLDWTALDRQQQTLLSGAPAVPQKMEAPPLKPASTEDEADVHEAEHLGMDAIRQGRVALCTVAGGQASRLGFDGPKGAFPLGSVSGTSLFQIMAGQVLRLRELTGAFLPWVIQTGPANHLQTERFFAQRNWFGLGSNSVRFVCQGTLPALSPEGQFLLATPGHLFQNPDGHGGFYLALQNTGTFDWLRGKGIDLLGYCQVDNPLVRMGDPVSLGFHIAEGADMSIKVIEKKDPEEKVGLVVQTGDSICCVEYSDISPERAAEQDADGKLKFRAGNTATHIFGLDFAQSCAQEPLEFHLAHKSIPALDGGLEPRVRPGIKFETFVFDALPRADKVVVQLSSREEEFFPVKNRSGVDSIDTSRAAFTARNRKWAESIAAELNLAPTGALEIEASSAYDLRDLRSLPTDGWKADHSGRLLRWQSPE